ncbi:MAG: site-2 protease family protein [Thermomicrobiales bacterium]|nr:site-2 protease family protein [Thermomicrobiales bacterium]
MLLLLGSQVLGGRQLPPAKQIVTVLGCFVIAVAVHEFMHAFVAMKLGDDTAERQGRVTLNPVSHFEPFGFFGMLMISLGYNFIGWGKPVPVNPSRLRAPGFFNGRRGMVLVALAGPLSNVAMAILVAIPLRMIWDQNAGNPSEVFRVMLWFFWVNALLASFNAIPIPPLDGYRILVGILPAFWTRILAPLERYGFLILILLFFIGNRVGSSSVTNAMISPISELIYRLLP